MTTVEAPETIEGWYVQHDLFAFQWSTWRTLAPARCNQLIEEAAHWLTAQANTERGDSAAFSLVGHKGDLLHMDYTDFSPHTGCRDSLLRTGCTGYTDSRPRL